MSKVTERVDRDPTKQPPWAKKFLDSLSNNFSSQIFHSPKTEQVIRTTRSFIAKKTLPITLLYTTKHYWSFKWDSEAEQTMFVLKWR